MEFVPGLSGRGSFRALYRDADLARIVLRARISREIVLDVIIRDQLIVRCRQPLLIDFLPHFLNGAGNRPHAGENSPGVLRKTEDLKALRDAFRVFRETPDPIPERIPLRFLLGKR